MTAEAYCNGWRQVRVFSRIDPNLWYPRALVDVVRPVFQGYPGPRLFFTRYVCPLGTDDADTNIADLPDDFMFNGDGSRWHASVRIRFCDNAVEGTIGATLNGSQDYWHSGFLDYDLVGDLGSNRFSLNQGTAQRLERARLVAETLRASCRLTLDCIDTTQTPCRFEDNHHAYNAPFGCMFRSIGHMIVNPWDNHTGRPVPFLAVPHGELQKLGQLGDNLLRRRL